MRLPSIQLASQRQEVGNRRLRNEAPENRPQLVIFAPDLFLIIQQARPATVSWHGVTDGKGIEQRAGLNMKYLLDVHTVPMSGGPTRVLRHGCDCEANTAPPAHGQPWSMWEWPSRTLSVTLPASQNPGLLWLHHGQANEAVCVSLPGLPGLLILA
jgi:hypothetical protein